MKNKFTWGILFLAVIGVLTYFAVTSKQETPLDIKTASAIEKIMDQSMKEFKSPGMIVGIWTANRGNFVLAKGLADIKTKRPVKLDERYRIGSLTKTFTATVILQLVDEGKLKLSDTLDKYFPGIPNSKDITMEQLLNMTSGLYSYTNVGSFAKKFYADRSLYTSPDKLISIGVSHKPDFAPGKGYEYSNTNYVILGRIIEKITGNKLENEFKDRIFNKLDMARSYFPISDSKMTGDDIRGYFDLGGKRQDWSDQNVSWGWAAGGIVSNLYDMKAYIQALGNGALLSKKMQKIRMTSWVEKSGNISKMFTTLSYGLGIFTAGNFVGHNGGMPGYVDMAMYDPNTKDTIVFMLNTQPSDSMTTLKVFKRIYQVLYPGKNI